jgi:ribosome-associated heat shock protein Hsp15
LPFAGTPSTRSLGSHGLDARFVADRLIADRPLADRISADRPLAGRCYARLMRIDKWLWAARFFKTRSLASKACDLGRIQSNQQPARPAREVRIGDKLSIKNEGGDFEVEVLALSEVRGPAALAQTLYQETAASRAARQKFAEERRAGLHFTPAPAGRPSKRDRRQIHRFRDDG